MNCLVVTLGSYRVSGHISECQMSHRGHMTQGPIVSLDFQIKITAQPPRQKCAEGVVPLQKPHPHYSMAERTIKV